MDNYLIVTVCCIQCVICNHDYCLVLYRLYYDYNFEIEFDRLTWNNMPIPLVNQMHCCYGEKQWETNHIAAFKTLVIIKFGQSNGSIIDHSFPLDKL